MFSAPPAVVCRWGWSADLRQSCRDGRNEMGFDLASRYGSAVDVLAEHAAEKASTEQTVDGDVLVTEMAVECGMPYNAVTGVPYKGGNILRLLAAEAELNYGPGGWAGFKQWLSVGRVVRKGEHGTACITVVTVTDKKGRTGTRPRGFKVFHYDQTQELAEVTE